MGQIEMKDTITFRWWNDEIEQIDFETSEILEASAREQIKEMQKEDYTSGELTENVNGIEFRGWWEFTCCVKEHTNP